MNAEPDDEIEALYRAAVGQKRADFYVPKFIRFDQPGASKASWNWSAFLISFYWFLYRRMFGYWAVCCLLIPIALWVGGTFAASLIGGPVGGLLNLLVIVGFSFVWIPMFANSLYHRTVKKRIATLRQTVPDRATQLAVLENAPHTSNLSWILAVVGLIAIAGLLAAIAIPAYQNFTIRAEVTEGLNLAEPVKAAIVERYSIDKSWPSGLADLGILQAPSGTSVSEVTVDQGTILIRYGNRAHALLANHVLSVRPTVGGDGAVEWTCGPARQAGDDPPTGAASRHGTDVLPQYLPWTCRNPGP